MVFEVYENKEKKPVTANTKVKYPCPNSNCRHNAASIETLNEHLNKCGKVQKYSSQVQDPLKSVKKAPKNKLNLKCSHCDFVATSQIKLLNHLQKELKRRLVS